MHDLIEYSYWAFAIAGVVLTALGHILYKRYSIGGSKIYLLLTAATFILIPVASFLALRGLTIAQVYLCAAMVPVITTFGARFFIKETITRHHIIGLGLITSGTVIYLIHSV